MGERTGSPILAILERCMSSDERVRVLYVEDEIGLHDVIRAYFEREGYDVDAVSDGNIGLSKALSEPYALIVLDIMVPGTSGLDILRQLRAHKDTPVILLTARGDEVDKLVGLEVGADDYVTKPFSPRELVARARAIMRRGRLRGQLDGVIQIGSIRIDTAAKTVRVQEETIHLTPTEYRIIEVMAAHPGRVFSRRQLAEAALGEYFEVDDRTIDAHMKNLRRKIEPDAQSPQTIITVRGFGYKVSPPEGEAVE